ncbi:MAG: phosphatase [Erysipelotrichaceae bacterium]|nr:phosphatase [Erysipelotrichaceae bacterium]
MNNLNSIDLHTHSVLSGHAFSSLTENFDYALSKGVKILGMSEHQYDEVGVGASHHIVGSMTRIPKEIDGMRILKGLELNILDGHFDIEKYHDRFNNLDYTIASMHSYVYSKSHTYMQNTDNYIMACNTDYITIIGHMDYSPFDCDYEAVIKEAVKNHKLIELNNSSIVPGAFRVGARQIDKEKILPLCIKHSCPIIVNSDAHIKYEIADFRSAELLLDEVNFPKELVVNYSEDKLREYIDF